MAKYKGNTSNSLGFIAINKNLDYVADSLVGKSCLRARQVSYLEAPGGK